jgi:hypothetical protein
VSITSTCRFAHKRFTARERAIGLAPLQLIYTDVTMSCSWMRTAKCVRVTGGYCPRDRCKHLIFPHLTQKRLIEKGSTGLRTLRLRLYIERCVVLVSHLYNDGDSSKACFRCATLCCFFACLPVLAPSNPSTLASKCPRASEHLFYFWWVVGCYQCPRALMR